MILFEITNSEQHPSYQALEIANGNRQYDFLRSMVLASLELQRVFLSQTLIKALNFPAIACLHTNAGEYRPCPVVVGDYTPPAHYRMDALMEDFVNRVNSGWAMMDPVVLATYVLWRMNNIHPFINGNGRTARAACYFVLCLRSGGWLAGDPILPELIKRDRLDYVAALKQVDAAFGAGDQNFLAPLHGMLTRLLSEQLQIAPPPSPSPEPVEPSPDQQIQD